jgi:hypothetical protein
MLPTAKLDVVNQALLELGRLPVVQISDSPDAQLISAKIDILLPLLLLKAEWNFAIKFRIDSTPLTQNFSTDFIYTYQLPADFGRFFKFSTTTFPLFYEFVGNLLLCNTFPIQYYYVVNTVDYAAITTMFYRALALYAAGDTCMTLTQNAPLAKYIMDKYKDDVANAILLNDQERYIQSTPYNDFDRQTFI